MGLARRSGASARIRRKASLLTSAGICVALLVISSVTIFMQRHDDEVIVDYQEPDASYRGHRRLADESSIFPADPILGSKPYKDSPNKYWIFIHVILIGYMLLGLNTVCDVYFTGALDVMVCKWEIKPDVAGATFMAAGGSAPELFTSLVGACISKNDVGFGTIVGSAVFNVLFVIGLCGFAAKEAIKLTWWPLFRDCAFYIVGLLLLAFCASDQRIEWYEAFVLFLDYLVYIAFMYNNEKIERYTDFEFLAASRSASKDGKALEGVVPDINAAPVQRRGSNGAKSKSQCQVAPQPEEDNVGDLRDESHELPCSILGAPLGDTGGSAVTGPQTSGSIRYNSTATNDSLRSIHSARQSERDYEATGTRSSRRDSSCRSSPRWSMHSSQSRLSHIHGKMHAMYFVGHMAALRHEERMAEFQAHGIDTLAEEEEERRKTVLAGTGAAEAAQQDGAAPAAEEEEEEEDEGNLMTKPEDGKERILWYLSLPVYVPLYYLTPLPCERWFMLTFAISLGWIAGFSFFMVWWFEILGGMLQIPTLIMGLTVIAAGTSIPDAASSVAVARMGEGDMAVSSSIGSNIFDILVGLPVPWMVKIGIIEMGDFRVQLRSDYLTFYVLLLMFMVLLVIISIHLLGWVLNKTLGCCMGILYAMFLISVLLVEGLKPDMPFR